MRWIAPLLVLSMLGCKSDGHWYFAKDSHAHAADWSYGGDTGPEHWGDLSPKYILAKTGRQQSPINIETAKLVSADVPPPVVHYVDEQAKFLNNGHTVEHTEGNGSWLEWKGKRYELAQFHFHTPSEHTIDGKHAPMEVHLVHKGAGNKVLVLAVMVNAGGSNAGMERASKLLPTKHGETTQVQSTINPASILPSDLSCYHYTGSFTTPPCTEGIIWLMLRTPVEAPAAVIDQFHQRMGSNNRPTQPLNGRVVETGK